MEIPKFNENGDLPKGIHPASLSDIIERFGKGSLKRQALALRLERVLYIAVGTGHLSNFILFGSFVTEKFVPNDIDIFMVMDDAFDYSKVTGETRLLFDHGKAQEHFGCSVFWIRRCAALGGEDEAIGYWQIKRDGNHRGIIRIIKEYT